MKDLKLLTRRGWMTAAVMVPLVFTLYYLHVYPWLSQAYKRDFLTTIWVSDYGVEEPKITINAPSFVADFVPREVILEASSTREEEVALTITVAEKAEEDTDVGEDRASVRLRSNVKTAGTEDNSTSSIRLVVPSHGSVFGTLWLDVPFQKEDGVDVKLQFFRNGDAKPLSLERSGGDSADTLTLTFSRLNAFKQSAIKSLLLPPWSNGVLPALVVSLIWFAEKPAARFAKWLASRPPRDPVCSHCGSSLPAGTLKCPKCGRVVTRSVIVRIRRYLEKFFIAPGRPFFLGLVACFAISFALTTGFLWVWLFVVSEGWMLFVLALGLLFILLSLAPYC